MTFLKLIQVLKLFDYTSFGHMTYASYSTLTKYGWSIILKIIGLLVEYPLFGSIFNRQKRTSNED